MGLASMAAVLKQQGHEVVVYDAELLDKGETLSWTAVAGRHSDYLKALETPGHPVWSEIEETVRSISPDVVGITALSVKAASAIRTAEISKSVDPGITTVVGADHPTALPEQFLNHPCIDFAVRGEGEGTFADLISCLEQGRNLGDGMIAGVSGRIDGAIVHGPDREPITDLDALPLPAIDCLLHADRYRPLDFGSIMTSRGCPYACTFCGVATVWGRKVRNRSPKAVVDEMEGLKQRFGTSYFSFRDASFTLSRERVEEICRLIIDRQLDIRWECLTRTDLLDEDMLELMSASGCVTVRLGIESGSPRILEYMGKTPSLDLVRDAAARMNRLGFYWTAYILLGTPHETAESMQQTMDFVAEIDPPYVTMARFAPIPGTAMYQELEVNGMISPDIDWSQECNQRLSSHYVYAMSESEFEEKLAAFAAFVEVRNTAKSAQLGARDQRLK
jgi:radical SAM superfamily enzyme YgiQ (UPF0313 family)